jgi:hypothetical protein
LRTRALRRGVWYQRLSPLERGVLELTARYVDEIKSSRLALVVSRILCKLLKALQSPFLRHAIQVGAPSVTRVSRHAVAWGHTYADAWVRDGAFIRFLGILMVNNLPGWSHP